MTLPVELAEMLDREAPPGGRFIRSWLLPLGGDVAAKRETGEQFPFTLVQRYDGYEDSVTDHGYYQLDHFHSDYTKCEDYARRCKRRMLYLRDHPWTEVTVPEWGIATADRVRCELSPKHMEYGDGTIERFTSRFYVALRLVTV